ncbi:sugar ABC transporter substrate-binding protein [Cerasicoccus frondis]|uniref:sugar ABC transporter substrate-binding protein n=1 Tax=Cerasicoccus frondis TaxID=490090 RepID=UPI0028524A96|nr:substrate-binding domain-containing protein [Cerasicoccus frondis]
MTRRLPIFLLIFFSMLAALNVDAARPREIWERYTVAYIGERRDDPINGAVIHGARQAADILEHEYNLEITILDLTPKTPAGQEQALLDAYVKGAKAVILNPAQSGDSQKALEVLEQQQVRVITIDHDTPEALRWFHIESDYDSMAETAFNAMLERMPRRGGQVAILSGDLDNPINASRLALIQRLANESPKVSIQGVYACQEDLSDSLTVLRTTEAGDRDEEITGWILLGPWPLMGAAPLPWTPGETRCVLIDALPQNLGYLARGQVDALVAETYFEWGRIAMDAAIENVHNQKLDHVNVQTGGQLITLENLPQIGQDWAAWLQ